MNLFVKSFVFFTGLLLPMLLISQTDQFNTDKLLPVDPNVKIGKLDNGLTYYIRANQRPANRAELTLIVNAGSVLEDEDQLGLAHFCEHMAFNGTKNFEKNELVNYLESIGMKFGPEVNAYTAFDQTVYGIKVPLDKTGFLDTGLLILSDWAYNISFDADEIEKERGVIHEEWRIGRGADERMMRKYLPLIFYKSRYADRLPIGDIDIIDNFKHESLIRFYKDWYRPDLMAVVVVGDIDPALVEHKIKSIFSVIPPKAQPREKKIFEIPDHSEKLVLVATDKEAKYSIVQLYYKHPLFVQKTIGDYRQSILHKLFNGMINKRLDELRQLENPPFLFGYSAYSTFLGPKDVYMSVAMTPNNGTVDGLKTLMQENERVKRFGFTASELEREKKALLKEIETVYNERSKQESENYVAEYTRNFGMSNEPIPGIEFEFELYKNFIPGISIDEINALASQWITDDNQVIIITGPEKEDAVYPTENEVKEIALSIKNMKIEPYVDRVSDLPLISKTPQQGKVSKTKNFKELDYTEWILSNGAKVVLKQTDFKDNQILFSAFSVGGTSLYDQKDDISSSVAAEVIQASGLSAFDKIELDKKISDKVVSIRPYISELEEGFEGQCAPEDIETMLQMLYLYFTQPRLSKDAFSSFMSKKKAEYENNSVSPEAVWSDTIRVTKAQYNQRRRPWTSEILEEADYKRIDKIFRERFADPNNFIFFFVGNFDIKKIRPLVETYIGGLPVLNRNEKWKDLGIRPPSANIDKTVYKGAENKSYVYINYSGSFDFNLRNKLEFEALCSILSTRLLEVVREEKSGTYSIGAYPSVKKFPVPLYDVNISFGCAPENVEMLTNLVNQEIEKLKKEGPSDIDLHKAKEKKIREREIKIKENNFWLSELKSIHAGTSDEASVKQHDKVVNSITKTDIQNAALKYFNNSIRVVLKPEDNN